MANNKLLASDYFLSGSLSSGWSAAFNSSLCQVVSHQTEPTALSVFNQMLQTGVVGDDQITEITLGTGYVAEGGNVMQLTVRYQPGVATVYQLQFSNTTATLYATVAGTSNVLLTLTGLTFAAGDKWALQVAGACLQVYQNYKQLGYTYDTSIPSGGAFGYGQFTSTALAHNTVASWRGYSCVQQDGVWQKQGPVIPGTAADLPYGSANPTNVIFESPSQLSLTAPVYKVWYTRWSENSVGYAESTDGKAWITRSTAVLASAFCGGVIKVASTYWMYIFTASGTGNCNAYSSSDGISWSLQASNIAAGTTYYFQPFTDGSGTYFVIAGANHLYTSTDMKTWTDQGATSGISGLTAGGITNVGSNWYCWSQQFNVAGESPAGTEIVRFKCSNPGTFTTWTKDCHSLHISQFYNSLNTFNGQVVSGGVFQVGNNTHALFTESPGDTVTPAIYQICLGIAPTTLANLVTQPEDAMPVIATEGFTGGIGGLGANWLTVVNPLQVIAGNLAEATVNNAYNVGAYIGAPAASLTGIEWSEMKIHALTSSGFAATFVRGAPATVNWYEVQVTGATGSTAVAKLFYRNGGGPVQIGPTSTTFNLVAEDRIRLEVFDGSDGYPVLIVFLNDFAIHQIQDYTAQYLAANGSVAGFWSFPTSAITDTQFSGWKAGNAATNSISGSVGLSNVAVAYSGPQSGSVTPDSSGNYYIYGLVNGVYTITPTLSGRTFSPVNSVQTISSASITGANFTPSAASSYYSVPDCRVVKPNSATGETNQGTILYDKQTSSNPAISPTDSRVAGAPVDSRVNKPTNSRTPGTFGPGE